MEDMGSLAILDSAEKIIKFKRNRLKENYGDCIIQPYSLPAQARGVTLAHVTNVHTRKRLYSG